MDYSLKDTLDAPPRTEGRVAKLIETQTSKIPSDTFLWAALGSMVVGGSLHLMGKKSAGNFFASLGPTFLVLGLYNKLVKVAGSDKYSGDGI